MLVVVYLADRTQRLAYDRALREAGHVVRLASRPAELAKAVSDGRVTLLVHDDASPVDEAIRSRVATITLHHDTTTGALVEQVRAISSVQP